MLTLTVPREDGAAKVLEDISAVAVLSTGERLVADRGQRGVFRFDAPGKYLESFSPIRASRIALGPVEQIALLDKDNKTVAVLDRDGQDDPRIATKATGYELTNPLTWRSTCWDTSTCSTESPCTCSRRTENWWPRLPAATKTLLAACEKGRPWPSTRRRGCTSTTTGRSGSRSTSDAHHGAVETDA